MPDGLPDIVTYSSSPPHDPASAQPSEDITTAINESNAVPAHGVITPRSFADASASIADQFREEDLERIEKRFIDALHMVLCKVSGLQTVSGVFWSLMLLPSLGFWRQG